MKLRDNFNLKTKEELAKRVAYRCSNPQCRAATIGPKEGDTGTINIGVAAHICAASEGGPRYNDNMTSEERSSYENGIWLCSNCATMIDRHKDYYTVEMLHMWKRLAELEASKEISGRGMSYEQISLSSNDKNVIENIIRVMEESNTFYMLKKFDYGNDFQRKLLDPLFLLMEDLRKPSSGISNMQLSEKVQDLLECIEEFRYIIAFKGGPAKYGNGSYIIDFKEEQKKANNICNDIWEKYGLLVATYRLLE